VNSGPFTGAGLVEQTSSGSRSLDTSAVLRSHETGDYSERRLARPIRDLLWFVLIGAVVGAVYGHMVAISDGAPLLGFGGLPRGVLTGVVITGALGATRDGKAARDAVLPHLAIKDGHLSRYCFGRSCCRSRAVSCPGRRSGRLANSAPGPAVLLCRGFSHKVHR
jgi:hypothetical protein